MSRVLRWALLLSLLLHVAALFAPGLLGALPEQPDDKTLDAYLVPAPQPLPPPKPKVQAPKPQPQPQSPTLAPVAAATPPAPPAAVAPPAAAIEASAAPIRTLPGAGRVRFSVFKGDNGFVVGQAIHEWHIDGDRYVLESSTETTGLVALFRSVRIVQHSTGTLTRDGLQPLEFVAERNGTTERANFDWQAMKVSMSNGNTASLQSGAQDFISMFYQFALYSLDAPEVTVMVCTGRKYERYVFQVLGVETLTIGGRAVSAYHLQTRAGDVEATEVWLAREFQQLPVKIRYTDRKGDSYQLVADEISIQEHK